MPASRSSRTANCLLRRLPSELSRGSQPLGSAAPSCSNASRGLASTNIFCSAVTDPKSSRTTPASSSPLSASRRIHPPLPIGCRPATGQSLVPRSESKARLPDS